jgi:uncharacterized membrane protein
MHPGKPQTIRFDSKRNFPRTVNHIIYKYYLTHMTPKTQFRAPRSRPWMALAIVALMVTCSWPILAAPASNESATEAARDMPPAPPKNIILCSMGPADPYYAVVTDYKDLRGVPDAYVVKFDPTNVYAILPTLKSLQPRYVTIIMKPLELQINFTREFLMMSTQLDDDPFSDFSYGIITGATVSDAQNFIDNIEKAETQGIQTLPLNWSGFSASSINFVSTYPMGYVSELNTSSYSMIYMAENDTGSGLNYFLSNAQVMKNAKVLDIGNNGDPHMVWLFEGGNTDPNPPVWDYNASWVEDPAHARVGLTSNNISQYDLFPAVAFNGACHSGETKSVMVEDDIFATFGDTGGVRRFYTMSDNFSFALSILKTNITGYFAPVGANNANEKDETLYDAFLYNEPLGDIAKRSTDGVIMGFLGNRPNLTIFKEGGSSYGPDIGPSGNFDPNDWSGAKYMLGGKANRVYFGDPLYNPYAQDHTDTIDYTTHKLTPINSTHLRIDLTTNKPSGFQASFWDKFHYSKTRVYEAIELPAAYTNVAGFTVINTSRPLEQAIHAIEEFGGRTYLHLELDTADDPYNALALNASFMISVPAPPAYGVDILGANQTKVALPGATVNFTFDVKNTGDLVDNISLQPTLPPTGWGFHLSFNGSNIAVGATRTAQVNISLPPNALFDDFANVTIRAVSQGNTSVKDTLNLTTRVAVQRGVDILGSRLTGRARPGETREFMVQVINTGNIADAYTLNITDINRQATVVLHNKTLAVGPKMTATTLVSVTAPTYALAGSNVSVRVNATSNNDSSKHDSTLLVTFVDPIFAFKVLGNDQTCSTAPGVPWNYELSVMNLGNSVDSYDITNSSAPMGWKVTFNITRLIIGPSNTDTAFVTITPFPEAQAGSNVTIALTVRSEGNSSMKVTVLLTTLITDVPRLQLIASNNQSSVPSRRLEYQFNLTNLGHLKDSYDIEATTNHGWLVIYIDTNRTGEIKPKGATNFTIDVIIPARTKADTVDILTVKVRSQKYPGIFAQTTVKTTVLPEHALAITMDKLTASIHTNENATFSVTVHNRGNAKLTITISVASEGTIFSWAHMSVGTFVLDWNESREIFFSVSPPLDAKSGNYTYTITAQGGSASQSVLVQVTVLKTKREDKNMMARALLTLGLLLLLCLVIVGVYMSEKRSNEPKPARPQSKLDEEKVPRGTQEEE